MSEEIDGILIVHLGSGSTSKITEIVRQIGFFALERKISELQPLAPPQALGYILSGGPHLVTEHKSKPVINSSLLFLKSITQPVLGICLGHQLLGLRFGASPYKGRSRRGPEKIAVLQGDHPLFQGVPSECEVAADHTEGISVPKDFFQLASSDFYKNEAMAHKTQPIYGVQFHPEISGEIGFRIISNFCAAIRALK
ncbi:MAG: gamma-glutamyl-gamma-aminobutyrate hydrolase family protein [Bdellovibrionales bacterium]|nr:gamma-glutamyl-gamma-aminobutyrate hydrolase family protein [Bdellovibrionales bacterium]